MDEITLQGPTHIAELDGGAIREWTLEPQSLGLRPYSDSDLRGATPATNAYALRATLQGVEGPFREATEANAAAALYVAGKAPSLLEGRQLAADVLDEGAPARLLDEYIELTQSLVRNTAP